MYCTNCGKEVKEGDKYCGNCGAELNSSNTSEEPVKKSDEELGLLAVKDRTFSNYTSVALIVGFLITIFFPMFKAVNNINNTIAYSIIRSNGYKWPCYMFILGGLCLLFAILISGRLIDRIKIYQLNKTSDNSNRIAMLGIADIIFLGLSIFLFIYSQYMVRSDLASYPSMSAYTLSYGGGALAMIIVEAVLGALYLFAIIYENYILKTTKDGKVTNAKVKR
ncbi:MAG: zinc-ribbon domain-containing protein [Coprobacillus sp.]|nr:zinc-ribbon domain-containing protein [Coprobacillus sp.]